MSPPKFSSMLIAGWVEFGWALFWIFVTLLSGDWLPDWLWVVVWIGIPLILYSIGFLVSNIVFASVSLFRWLAKREQPPAVTFLPSVILLVTVLLATQIPSRTAITFYLHRDEFISLATSAVSKLQNIGKRGLRLPESPLYEWASAGREFPSKALVVEFIIGDSYPSLVYISTDDPADTHGACFEDGGPLERLEPNWYVCLRDLL